MPAAPGAEGQPAMAPTAGKPLVLALEVWLRSVASKVAGGRMPRGREPKLDACSEPDRERVHVLVVSAVEGGAAVGVGLGAAVGKGIVGAGPETEPG